MGGGIVLVGGVKKHLNWRKKWSNILAPGTSRHDAIALMKHWCKYAFSEVEIELDFWIWSLNWGVFKSRNYIFTPVLHQWRRLEVLWRRPLRSQGLRFFTIFFTLGSFLPLRPKWAIPPLITLLQNMSYKQKLIIWWTVPLKQCQVTLLLCHRWLGSRWWKLRWSRWRLRLEGNLLNRWSKTLEPSLVWIIIIWVRFPRTGKMLVLCLFFFFFFLKLYCD